VAFQTDYRGAAWAHSGRGTEKRVRKAESVPVSDTEILTEVAARCLFKLMAYKDMYEVALVYPR
jgi:indolepyruvate ferredoxin oxidoreductase